LTLVEAASSGVVVGDPQPDRLGALGRGPGDDGAGQRGGDTPASPRRRHPHGTEPAFQRWDLAWTATTLYETRASSDIVGQAHVLLGLGKTLARQARQRIVEGRVLFVLGAMNPAQRAGPARRGYLTQRLAIFGELELAHWQQQASSALRRLDGPGDSALLQA
jgi:hypothetical protein